MRNLLCNKPAGLSVFNIEMTEREFKNVVYQHKDAVFRYAFYLLKHQEDAEDVTQEAFVRFWKYARYKQVGSIKSWLLRVTHNLCVDKLRRRQFERKKFPALDATLLYSRAAAADGLPVDPETQFDANELRRVFMDAVEKLPHNLRTPILLREVEGLKYAEIAEVLDLQLHNVKAYLHRAKKILKKELAPYLQPSSGAKK